MDEETIISIMEKLTYLETAEIKIHLENRDTDEWTEEAFEAMKRILLKRGDELPDASKSMNDGDRDVVKIMDYKDFFPKRIPGYLEDKVLSIVELNSSEKIILFIDQSFFKKGTTGNIFTSERIHIFESRGEYNSIPYQDIKHVYLLGKDEGCNDILIQLNKGEIINAGFITAEACPLAVRLLSDYTAISRIRKKHEVLTTKREAEIGEGIFHGNFIRDDSILEDESQNYIAFPAENKKITINDEGIQLPDLPFLKPGLGEHFGRTSSKGVFLHQMLITQASSKNISLKINWENVFKVFEVSNNPSWNRRVIIVYLRADINRIGRASCRERV